ncbi:SGNH/GDSL hydrolase family protein [Aurantiacibacter flavus]|uniref:SGNH/GDSL hydrolase family protein n=1 Tax=Aurantiacibacter flavus TaxID=3145232 RepID=A0ABV0CUD1_9SPHN
MGSSFAAGAGIGPNKPGTPERCNRAVNNYPSLLAAHLNLALEDESCGGATSAHLLDAWNELPAQLSAVRPDTRLVTITVGGNDLNYMGLLFSASCDPAVGMAMGGETRSCPDLPHRPSDADYAALETNLRQIVREIHDTAPAARVVFVQYVTLVPEELCSATPISANAAEQARELAHRLAEVTASAARASGAEVLSVDTLSASHTVCDPRPFSRGFSPTASGPGAPWHPTAQGHTAIAEALAAMLSS